MGDISSQEKHATERESSTEGGLVRIGAFKKEAVKILEANRGRLSSLLHDISRWKEQNPLEEDETAHYRCGEGGKAQFLRVTSVEVPALEGKGEQLTIESRGQQGAKRVAFYWSGEHDTFSGLVSVGSENFYVSEPNKGTDIYGFRGCALPQTELFDHNFPLLGSSYWKGSYPESKGRSFVHQGGDAVQQGKEIFDILKSGHKIEGPKP